MVAAKAGALPMMATMRKNSEANENPETNAAGTMVLEICPTVLENSRLYWNTTTTTRNMLAMINVKYIALPLRYIISTREGPSLLK
jgi:hypothetical protein